MTSTHPRQYRVTRRTPGVTWSSWTHTYHPTLESAQAAARRFFDGEGRYVSMKKYLSTRGSTVEIAERHEFRRYVRYEPLQTITGADYLAQVAEDEDPLLSAHVADVMKNGAPA